MLVRPDATFEATSPPHLYAGIYWSDITHLRIKDSVFYCFHLSEPDVQYSLTE